MKWLYKKDLKDINSIKKVEQAFGFRFPSDYKKIVLAYNGATPSPNAIDTSRQTGKAFGELLDFNLDANENIIILYEELKNKIPEKVYPITMDPGGNFLCYDFRDDEANPEVVRWDHEQKSVIEDGELIIPDREQQYQYYHLDFVAKSFTEAITNLYGEEMIENNLDEVIWEDFLSEEKLKEFDDETLAQVNKRLAKKGLPPITK